MPSLTSRGASGERFHVYRLNKPDYFSAPGYKQDTKEVEVYKKYNVNEIKKKGRRRQKVEKFKENMAMNRIQRGGVISRRNIAKEKRE